MKSRLVTGWIFIWLFTQTLLFNSSAHPVNENDYHIELEGVEPEEYHQPEEREDYHYDEVTEEKDPPVSGNDKELRRLGGVKTYALPTRVRTRPIFYRPDWPSNKNTTPALVDRSTTKIATTTQTTTEKPTTPTSAPTDDNVSTVELDQNEDWLMAAIEEVAQSVQVDLSPYKDVDQILVTELPVQESSQTKESLSHENSLLYTAGSVTNVVSATTTPSPVSVSSSPLWIYSNRLTSTPSPTTPKTFSNRWTAVPARKAPASNTSLGRWGTTSKLTTTTTKPSTKSVTTTQPTTTTTRQTTTIQKRSTVSMLPSSLTTEIPTTTEWWLTKPNFEFASLGNKDQADELYDYTDSISVDVDDISADRTSPELPPPPPNPNFNIHEAVQSTPPRRPLSVSTPSHPILIKSPQRTTTSAPKTTARTTTKTTTTTRRPTPTTTKPTTTTTKPKTTTKPRTTKPTKPPTTTKKAPAQISIKQTSNKPDPQVFRLPQLGLRPPFPAGVGVTDIPGNFQEFSSTTIEPVDPTAALEIEVLSQEIRPVFPVDFTDILGYEDPPTSTTPIPSVPVDVVEPIPINFVIVNIWNYVNGQLTLVGQQVVPSQVLAGINITNGATIQSSSLPDTILDQLTSLLAPTTTTTTTTTTMSPRPYGGVGNPTLLGIVQAVEVNNSANSAIPSLTYSVPKPSTTYGVPKPSTTYGAPPIVAPPPIRTSYVTPPTPSPVRITFPPLNYGPPPAPPKSMNQFVVDLQPPPFRLTTPPTTSAPVTPHRVSTNTFFSQLQLKPPLSPPSPPGSPEPLGVITPQRPIKTQQRPNKRPVPNRNPNRPNRRPQQNNKRRPTQPPRTTTTTEAPNNNLNFVESSDSQSSGHFVASGANPLGALLPDFILESLVQQVQALPLDPLNSRTSGLSSRIDDNLSEEPASSRGDSFPEEFQSISRVGDATDSAEDDMTDRNVPSPVQVGPKATETVDDNNDPVIISTRSKRPFVSRPYATSHLSAMEIAYGDAVGARLIPVAHHPSQPAHPLDMSHGVRRGVEPFSAAEGNVEQKEVVQIPDPVVTSTARPIPRTTTTRPTTTTVRSVPPRPTKADRRFSVQGFKSLMPAAAISAAALSLPMLVGRKRRSAEQHPTNWPFEESVQDSFVKHFTMENEREMRQKNIAASHCRQLSVDESAGATHQHLLICPGHESRTLNMILLDGLTR